MADARELRITGEGGVVLSGEEAGCGTPVLLLHGLTAVRRYVVMGSRALERSGHRVIAYDARGHGRSAPAPAPASAASAAASEGSYGYGALAEDLRATMDALEIDRAVLAGVSMGAQTAVRFVLAHPDRVAALALITPAFDPGAPRSEQELARWDALAEGLRRGGVEGFVKAYDLDAVPEGLRATVGTVLRQRLAAHEHPGAVADALEAVPRSRPFEELDQLRGITAPVAVIASRDEADPGHPLAVAELYAHTIPDAELHVEEEGRSPLAWQGGQVSRVIASLAARATPHP